MVDDASNASTADVEIELINAILKNGSLGFTEAKRNGIGEDSFSDPKVIDVWKLINSHVIEYGLVPSVQYVDQKIGWDDTDPPEPVRVYIDQLRESSVWKKLLIANSEAGHLLNSLKPKEALEALSVAIRDIKQSSVGANRATSIWSLGSGVRDYYDKVSDGFRGIETPWIALNDATMGFWPGDFSVFVGRQGTGKCVAWNTEIPDPITGMYRKICDVVNEQGKVWTRDNIGVFRSVFPDAHLYTGVKRCLRVRTQSGLEIVVTPEHPLSVSGEWVKAEDISIGDYIETVHWMPEPESPIDDMSYDDVQTEAFDAIERIEAGGDFPDRIFSYCNDLLSVLLGVIWDCCGIIGDSGNIVMVNRSDVPLRQMKRLLLRFGITSSISDKSFQLGTSMFQSWELRIHKESIGLFYLGVAVSGDRASRILESIFENLASPVFDSPVPMTMELHGAISDSLGDLHPILGHPASPRMIFRDAVRAKEFQSMALAHWDKVVSIDDAGDQEVYDLTVFGPHCFVANDIVAHNTQALLLMARHAWLGGKRVLFVGTEMSREKLALRLFSIHLNLRYEDFRKGNLDSSQREKFNTCVSELENESGFDIYGSQNFKTDMEGIEIAIDDGGYDIVFIDAIYLLRSKGKNRQEQLANVADELKMLAIRKHIPVVCTHQFNRNADSKKDGTIVAENLALSDAVGWNADSLIGLWQTPDLVSMNQMGINFMKLREGRAKDFFVNWNWNTMDFSQVDRRMGSQSYNSSVDDDGTVDVSSDESWI